MLQVSISSIRMLIEKSKLSSLDQLKTESSLPGSESGFDSLKDLADDSNFEDSLVDIVRSLSSETKIEEPCYVVPD